MSLLVEEVGRTLLVQDGERGSLWHASRDDLIDVVGEVADVVNRLKLAMVRVIDHSVARPDGLRNKIQSLVVHVFVAGRKGHRHLR